MVPNYQFFLGGITLLARKSSPFQADGAHLKTVLLSFWPRFDRGSNSHIPKNILVIGLLRPSFQILHSILGPTRPRVIGYD
jgi:hypothetical protein